MHSHTGPVVTALTSAVRALTSVVTLLSGNLYLLLVACRRCHRRYQGMQACICCWACCAKPRAIRRLQQMHMLQLCASPWSVLTCCCLPSSVSLCLCWPCSLIGNHQVSLTVQHDVYHYTRCNANTCTAISTGGSSPCHPSNAKRALHVAAANNQGGA